MSDAFIQNLNVIAANSLQRQKLEKIKSNASNLDDVLTFRVNSALKKEFSRICKENQSSASSELSAICSKLLSKVLYNFNRSIDEFTPHLLS